MDRVYKAEFKLCQVQHEKVLSRHNLKFVLMGLILVKITFITVIRLSVHFNSTSLKMTILNAVYYNKSNTTKKNKNWPGI